MKTLLALCVIGLWAIAAFEVYVMHDWIIALQSWLGGSIGALRLARIERRQRPMAYYID